MLILETIAGGFGFERSSWGGGRERVLGTKDPSTLTSMGADRAARTHLIKGSCYPSGLELAFVAFVFSFVLASRTKAVLKPVEHLVLSTAFIVK